MSLSILARLRDGRYDAGGGRSDVAEWPPHPARVFCALVASAVEEGHWAALRWLEAAGAPEVWACAGHRAVRREGYVVANATDRKATSQHHLGRAGRKKARVSAEPDDPQFALVWPQATADAGVVASLRRLARGVPYLGRSTSPVALQVTGDRAEVRAQWRRLVPTQLGQRSVASLRVPYEGYTDRLREIYREGGRSWEADFSVPYTDPDLERLAVPVARSPFDELLVFGFASGTVKPPGEALLAVTARLRAAVLARIGEDVPAEVSGHGAEDRRHVGYLALPNVGYQHADGRLLGVAVAVPEDLPRGAYARLWGALVERPLERVTMRRDQVLHVEHRPSAAMTWGLNPQRWTAEQRGGARTWVSATPMMLDRFTKRRGDDAVISEIGRSLVRAGFPEPEEWWFSPAGMIRGALHRPGRDTMPSNRPVKPMVHVRVRFCEPVVGPVLVGSLRYLGLGLFVPAAGDNGDG